MRKYGKTVKSECGFSIVEILNENGDLIGYVVLTPDGSETFCESLEEAFSIFNKHLNNVPEDDNGPSFG